MAKKQQSPSEVVQEIEKQAKEVRRAAAALSSRIKAFEKWLTELPGRVTAICDEPDDPEERTSFNVSFRKEGKEWALYHFLYDDEFGRELSEPSLLRDASLDVKTRAIRMFPKLLSAVRDAQEAKIKQADELSAEFDEFAKEIGLKEGQ